MIYVIYVLLIVPLSLVAMGHPMVGLSSTAHALNYTAIIYSWKNLHAKCSQFMPSA